MKRLFLSLPIILFICIGFSGCTAVGGKNASLSIIYGTAALISLLLLIGCVLFVRKKKTWFLLLFSSVLVVNIGYTFLSVSPNLEMALWANRVSYLGSVFLPFSMFMNILNVTNTSYKKILPNTMFCIAIVLFLIAASPGILPIYYKDVSFEVVNGVSTLQKVYGPLHPLYLVYLLGYFAVMVAVIIRAQVKKTIDTTSHAVIIAIAVFVNIGVWLIEQLTKIDFEMLSISYIISELFLLGVHIVMNENQRLREIVKKVEAVQDYKEDIGPSNAMLEKPIKENIISAEQIEVFISGLNDLTPTEKVIYDSHIKRMTSKEIMADLNIKETTLKFHNKNLYSKLGVTSRKELLEAHKQIKNLKQNLNS